jgi:xylulokinase
MRESTRDEYLIGFDLGTSAMKAVLSDACGTIVCQASRQVELLRTEDGRVELDAERYFHGICSVIGELVSNVGVPSDIRAVCLSGASGNTLLLDADYNPVRNAISWLDTRTAGKESELWPDLDPEWVYRSAGWPFGGTFPLAHLGWLKASDPDAWGRARHFTMLNDYLYHRLCGRLVVDHSKATTFYLQDQEASAWNSDLLASLGLETDQLSELLPSGAICGEVTREALEATGLAPGTRVVTGSFDHPSAARSTGVFAEGDLLISAGTSWVVFAPIKDRKTGLKGRMLIDPFLSPSGCWGSMFALTAVAEKMNVYLEHCIASTNGEPLFDRFNRLAAEAVPGAEGLTIELFKEPYEANKEIVGKATPASIARALMEGIVFLTRNRVEQLMRLTGSHAGRIVLTGGPTKSPVWPSILADVLNRPVAIPEIGEHAGAMGAVLLAGIGAGIFQDEEEGYVRTRSSERIIEPDAERSELYENLYSEYVDRYGLELG